jgi:hypothetical protein
MDVPNTHLLNSILVDAEVRPAMMVQPIDFGETSAIDKTTQKYLANIKHHFPDLKYSDNYTWFQGIIISKQHDYNGAVNIGSEQMGDILGYPCSADFMTIINNEGDPYSHDLENIYNIEIVVDTADDTIQLFGNRCIGNSELYQYMDIAQKAEVAFKLDKYHHIVSEMGIRSVRVVSNLSISVNTILGKMIRREPLPHEYYDEIVNYMWNLNDPGRLSEYMIDHIYEPSNGIHNGVLMMILLNCHPKYNRDSPMYGEPSPQLSQADTIRFEWFKAMIKLFKKTRSKRRQSTGILTRLKTYIYGPTTLLDSSDVLSRLIDKVFDRQPLNNEDIVHLSVRLRNISDNSPQAVSGILNTYDPTNLIHVGLMMMLMLELIPTYDTTLPLQQMDSSTYQYQRYKEIGEVWLDNVYLLFARTNFTPIEFINR